MFMRIGVISRNLLAVSAAERPWWGELDGVICQLASEGCELVLTSLALGGINFQISYENCEIRSRLVSVVGVSKGEALVIQEGGRSKVLLGRGKAADVRRQLGRGLSLGDRQFGNRAFLLAGSELNLITYRKTKKLFEVPEALLEAMHGSAVIISPSASLMRRWEMNLKRAYLSETQAPILSVWNRMSEAEPAEPWSLFVQGRRRGGFRRIDCDRAYEVGIIEVPLNRKP